MSLHPKEPSKAAKSLGYIIAVGIVGVVLISAFAGAYFSGESDHPDETENAKTMHARANRLFLDSYSQQGATESWERTADAYSEIVEKYPDDGEAWFRLGFSLHFARHLDEAIEANKVASTFKRGRPLALYNIACSYALKEDTENALSYLEQAIEAGFRAQQPIENDTDLEILKDNERFQELALASRPAAQLPERKRMDFWIGRWVVYVGEKRVGVDTVIKEENGFLLVEKFSSDEGTTGQSSNWYDAANDEWVHQWFDSSGSVTTYRGNWVEEEAKMMFQGEHVAADGQTMRMRMAFTPRPDGTIHQLIESTLDGETWTECFEATYLPNGGQYRERSDGEPLSCTEPPCRDSLASPGVRGNLMRRSS